MDTLTKEINDIIINESDLINGKLRGLNFLESFKLKLIEKILPIIDFKNFPLDKPIEFESKLENKLRILVVLINYYNKPITISRKKMDDDTLFILFNENANLNIYEEDCKTDFKSLILYKNTGVCLPHNTLINAKLNKNTLLIEIKNKDLEKPLKK
tara:strand:+ start:151 stop:618 length:468 start_codon:yes stop_codon:yes gene_type:complete